MACLFTFITYHMHLLELQDAVGPMMWRIHMLLIRTHDLRIRKRVYYTVHPNVRRFGIEGAQRVELYDNKPPRRGPIRTTLPITLPLNSVVNSSIRRLTS